MHNIRKIKKIKKIRTFFQKRLDKCVLMWYNIKVVGTKATWWHDADIAQLVEHVIGNDEVISSNLIISSKNPRQMPRVFV